MRPLARIRLATSLALLLGFSAHAQTLGLCKLLLHPERYNSHMIRIHGTIDAGGISDHYCTPPLDFHTPFDRGIRVGFRPVRNRDWYKFWYYKSFPSEYSGKNPPFYNISGTFYGLFRYRPPKSGSEHPQSTLILASVSNLTVKKIQLPLVTIMPSTPRPPLFPVSPPHTYAAPPAVNYAAPPDANLDWLFPVAPPPVQVSGPRQ